MAEELGVLLRLLHPLQGGEQKKFKQQLETEIMRNEYFRAVILAVIAGSLLVTMAVVFTFFTSTIRQYPEYLMILKWTIAAMILLFNRSLVIGWIIERRRQKGQTLPSRMRYSNVLLEVSVPSVIILLYSNSINPVEALLTPVVFVYFLFIILTTLELDFRLSVFAGAVAGLEYIALAFFFTSEIQASGLSFFGNVPMFIGKGMLMIVMGIVAGVVTEQIKKRMFTTYETVAERDRIENLFGQQVSHSIVNEMLKREGDIPSSRLKACIMFLDIKDFTPFCEGKNPEEIVRYQNDVFSLMIDIIDRHRGIINQFVGDGFMATFGAPISSGNDCDNAVRSGLEIVEEVQRRSAEGTLPPTGIRIGMHYGDIVAGNVGTSIRKQYSITGNPVILAARMEQLNKALGSTFIISREVYDQLSFPVEAEDLGEHKVKGRKEPMQVMKLA